MCQEVRILFATFSVNANWAAEVHSSSAAVATMIRTVQSISSPMAPVGNAVAYEECPVHRKY